MPVLSKFTDASSGTEGFTIRINAADKLRIDNALRGMKYSMPSVLRSAINKTATRATTMLKEGVKKKYTLSGKKTENFPVRRASQRNLIATIDIKGKPSLLSNFASSRKTPKLKGASAHVLTATGMQELIDPDTKNKAFIMMTKNDKRMIAQRRGKPRLPVKILSGPSIAKMIGGKQGVYQQYTPLIQKELQTQIDTAVKGIVEKTKAKSV